MKDITTLIKQALSESPKFTLKFNYWVNIRNKRPDQEWLYKQLLEVYGSHKELTKKLKAIKETT